MRPKVVQSSLLGNRQKVGSDVGGKSWKILANLER